ncbi:MAG: hypothetical protein HQL95_14665 [Magnetococcales bacterium]|nr:hypothetical protein [Magnetococcales bacterium]
MNAERVRERLIRNNPLASVATGSPWERVGVDVPAINRIPFEGVIRLFRQIARSPGEPLAALVLGEVGNGKSHLLARLRTACQQEKQAGAFVLVTPPENGAAPFRYLLREIADCLRHPPDDAGDLSSWHHLAALLIVESRHPRFSPKRKLQEIRKLLKTMRQGKGSPAKWWQQVRAAPFLDALPQEAFVVAEILVRWLPASPEVRREALAWLRGDAVSGTLLPARLDRSEAGLEEIEEQARALLIGLGALLAHVQRPMLLCFDRLEDLRAPVQHAAMDIMLTFLVDRMSAALPVVLARGQFWETLRLERWNAQTVGRLESNRFEMTGCSRAEAEMLVRDRLEAVLGTAGMKALFFDPSVLLESIAPGRNAPRIVLTLANRRLQEMLELPARVVEDPESRLAKVWESLTSPAQNVRRRADPMRPERILQVLRLYLLGNENPAEAGDAQEMSLEQSAGEGRPARLWLVESLFHPKAVIHTLEQGLVWLKNHPGGQITYVRDGRHPIPPHPKWPETNRLLRRFQEHGGRLLSLSGERIARWHAIGELHDAVRCGEVTWIDAQNREQPVPLVVLNDFLRLHFATERVPPHVTVVGEESARSSA